MNTCVEPNVVTKTGNTVGLQKLLCAPNVGKAGDAAKMFQPNCGDTADADPEIASVVVPTPAGLLQDKFHLIASVILEPDAAWPVPGRYGWAGGYGTIWFNVTATSMSGLVIHDSIFCFTRPLLVRLVC